MKRISVFLTLFLAFDGNERAVIAQPTSGLENIVEPGMPELIAGGLINAEGPLWHPDGFLLFSEISGNTIFKWTSDRGVETFRSPSGHSNGLTFDRQGRLIVCEHSNSRTSDLAHGQVSRTERDGTITTLAYEYEGNRLNSPNDVVVRSDGSIYFTDPPFGLDPRYGISGAQELAFQGVHRLWPDGKTLELLADDIYRPNGLAFSPDEQVLYVSNTHERAFSFGEVLAFDVQSDGSLSNRRVFIAAAARSSPLGGFPDGIKVDIDGNLYVADNVFVRVYDRTGQHLGDIVVPEMPRNCAFGGFDSRSLFITTISSVYRVQTKIQGIPALVDSDHRTVVSPQTKTWGMIKQGK